MGAPRTASTRLIDLAPGPDVLDWARNTGTASKPVCCRRRDILDRPGLIAACATGMDPINTLRLRYGSAGSPDCGPGRAASCAACAKNGHFCCFYPILVLIFNGS